MKKVQQAGDYSIYQKRSGRYGVQDKTKNWVNAEEKTKVLLEAGLISIPAPKPAAPEEAEETTAGEAAPSETVAGEEPAS